MHTSAGLAALLQMSACGASMRIVATFLRHPARALQLACWFTTCEFLGTAQQDAAMQQQLVARVWV